MTIKSWWSSLASSLLILTLTNTQGAVRPVLYSPHADKFDCHMNMGPTGAGAWMRGYELVVMRIDQGSPAYGNLQLGDVVYAADGTTFGAAADPRITLGDAIGKAEATGRPLKLTIRRDGKRRKVSIQLPKLGSFSDSWPARCQKSDRILDAACRSLLDVQMPDGEVITDGNMGTFLTGLLLLASDDPAYLDGARRAAYQAITVDYDTMSYNNWPMGYGGLLMAEYYLATGDDTVLPKLAEITAKIAKGQMMCGSWGHSSPSGGYGALNQPGIICAMTLALAKECGIEIDQTALDKALRFFGRYAEIGSIPYGDHFPAGGPDDNGHNASAAILMKLAGKNKESSAFSESVAMSYWMREEGHTGGFFSIFWGPLGASLAGEEAFRAFLDYQRWYYNLCRTWKGELVHLPYYEALTRFDSSGYIYGGGDSTTGGMTLLFALPRNHLRILGAPESVFSPGVKLSGPLQAARQHYLAREWRACDTSLAGIKPSDLTTLQDKHGFSQLKAARALARESTERVLLEIESNLVEGAAYRASEQYKALTQCLGEQADARFEQLDQRLAEGNMEWYIREGKQYYEAWRGLRGFAVKSWVPQGWQAKMLIEGLPSLRQPIWEPLSPVSNLTPQTWRTLLLEKDQDPPKGWEKVTFDDSSWKQTEGVFTSFDQKVEGLEPSKRAAVLNNMPWREKKKLAENAIAARRHFTIQDPEGVKVRIRLQTVRPAQTKVYLNGTLVVSAVRGQRGGYAAIVLDDAALGLLHKGENVLAVTSTRQGAGGNHLDVGLEINRQFIDKRTLPVLRTHTVFDTSTRGFFGGRRDHDYSLKVKETKNKMGAKLQASYDNKPIAELLSDLGSIVAYRRHLAETALVSKGLAGINPALALADDPDWKVRAAVCDVINQAFGAYNKQPKSLEMALITAKLPLLVGLIHDEHFWVRVRALSALSRFEQAAAFAVPQVLTLIKDPDPWVRLAAIQTIGKINPDPDKTVEAALQALMIPTTAYNVPGNALRALTKYSGTGPERLEALLSFLRHPPEGGGGRLLNNAMEMAVALDPEGKQVIPVLMEIVSDVTHYSRQRANPRGKAIVLLGEYGTKASKAIPLLKKIIQSDEKKDQTQKEACQKALAAITGR